MNYLTDFEIQAITWHLTHNALPALNANTSSRIIDSINQVRDGSRNLDDLITSGSDCTIGQMIQDLKLGDYIPQEINFNYFTF